MSTYTTTTHDGVTYLTLCRPEASNALSVDFWRRFPETIRELDRLGKTRALVLRAEGRNFCAGIDVSCLAGDGIVQTDTAHLREVAPYLIQTMQDTFSAMETARFPVIAAIQGACIGAGLELAAACDLRFCTDDAIFRLEEINVGIMADVGALQRLPLLLPEGVVKEMSFLGTTLDSARAHNLGFVAGRYDTIEATQAAADAAAHAIKGKAPLAVAGTKRSIAHARDHSLTESLEWASLMQSTIWNMDDVIEAVAARREKRSADFRNLEPQRTFGEGSTGR